LSRIFKTLARTGALEIVKNLEKRTEGLKYAEIEKIIGSPSTTTRRLNELEELGIVKREILSEKYRPVKYSLTKKGKELLRLVKKTENLFR
jgi:DNA-binding HxlR family transcriptional regulator